VLGSDEVPDPLAPTEEEKDPRSSEPTSYEIEEILGHRQRRGEYQFHIKWRGYEDKTWEPSDNVPSRDVARYLLTRN